MYNKYIKYKKKYLELKKLLGGKHPILKSYEYITYKSALYFSERFNVFSKLLNPFNLSIISHETYFIGSVRLQDISTYYYFDIEGEVSIKKFIDHKDKDKLKFTGEENETDLISHDELIVPGNKSFCKQKDLQGNFKDLDPPYNLSKGSHFLWNNWNLGKSKSQTRLIKIEMKDDKYITTNIEIDIKDEHWNIIKLRKIDFLESKKIIINHFYNTLDMRLMRYKDDIIIAYGHDQSIIFKLEYDDTNNKMYIIDCLNYYRMKGNNLTLITFDKKSITYIDWFYKDGIKIITRTIGKRPETTYNFSRYVDTVNDIVTLIEKKDGFSGSGLCDKIIKEEKKPEKDEIAYPLFSLSTPLLILTDDENITTRLGVGHVKIKNMKTCEYKSNSKLDNFRTSLHETMYSIYNDKYKVHLGSYSSTAYIDSPNAEYECNGYIYMMYFYYLIYNKSEKKYTFSMSDAFLPLNVNEKEKEKYKFSLFFPAGLTMKDNDIYVSGGEGDYYSIIMKFDIEWVKSKIIYDYQTLDIAKYSYYCLVYKDNKTHIIEDPKELADIISTK